MSRLSLHPDDVLGVRQPGGHKVSSPIAKGTGILAIEIGNPEDGDNVGGLVQYIENATPANDYGDSGTGDKHRDAWVPDDVVYGNLGTLQTASVVIRSMFCTEHDCGMIRLVMTSLPHTSDGEYGWWESYPRLTTTSLPDFSAVLK